MPSDKTPIRILVVDADEPSAASLVAVLAAAGYSTSVAHGATEAATSIEAARPNLVAMDIKTPAPTGLAVAGMLRLQFDDLPLLFISALHDDQTVHQAAALGAIAYVVKPDDLRQIIPTIEMALARAEDLRRLRQNEIQLASAVEQTRTTGAAVGILVERLRLDRQEAFETLRRHARSHRRTVSEVAEQLLSSVESLNALAGATSQTQPRRR